MRSAGIVLLVGCLSVSAVVVMHAAQDETSDAVFKSEELVVLLARIKQQLDRPATMSLRGLMRLDYYVTVYGRTPQLDVVAHFDLPRNPVPMGPPHHTVMMRALRGNTSYPHPVPLGSNPVAGWAWRMLR